MIYSDKPPIALFPKSESVGPRSWGTETLLVLAQQKYTLKLIEMKQGAKGGLQYHRRKDEAGIVIRGEMAITYDDGTGALVVRHVVPGDVFHFPTGCVHQATAVTECAYFEVSTPHFHDRVHVENVYGRDTEDGGLPTTQINEIEIR